MDFRKTKNGKSVNVDYSMPIKIKKFMVRSKMSSPNLSGIYQSDNNIDWIGLNSNGTDRGLLLRALLNQVPYTHLTLFDIQSVV